MKARFFLFFSFFFPLFLTAGEYLPYTPPFAADPGKGVRRAETKYVEWKLPTFYAGTALSLQNFPELPTILKSSDMKLDYGWIVLRLNDQDAIPKRQAEYKKEKIEFLYPGHGRVSRTLSLLEDGRVKIVYTLDPKDKTELQIRLKTEHFGNSLFTVGGKSFRIPPYRPGKKYEKKWYSGPLTKAAFFADQPDKRIDFDFPAGTSCKVSVNGGDLGFWMSITPPAGTEKFTYFITPGTQLVKDDADGKPAGYVTKIGQYDFWKENRLRLPDHQNRKNLLTNSSFEQDFYALWSPFCNSFSPELWKKQPVAIDDTQHFQGKKSLRIFSDKRMAGVDQSIAFHHTILTPGKYTVSFYAKTDSPGKQRLRITDRMLPPGCNTWNIATYNGQDFTLTGEWKRYSRTLDFSVTQPHYFYFDAHSEVPASCYVDAVQIEKGETATDYEPDPVAGVLYTNSPDNLWEPGTKAGARWEIITPRPETAGRVTLKVTDFFGKVVRTFDKEFKTGADGRVSLPVDLENLPPGVFVVDASYVLANGTKRYEFTRFSIMKFLANTHKHKLLFCDCYIDPLTGSQLYPKVLERYQKIGIGSRAAVATLQQYVVEEAKKYGVETVSAILLRQEANPDKNMPQPNGYFSVLKDIVWYATPSSSFQRDCYADITLPLPADAEKRLAAIEEATARRVRENPWIQVWSPINEAEGSLPEYCNISYASEEHYRQYVALELAVARGIKKGNPAAKVAPSTTSSIRKERLATIDKLLTETDGRFRYDAFTYHMYRDTPEQPDIDDDLENLIAVLNKHGYTKEPIYAPEAMHYNPYWITGLVPPVDPIGIFYGPFSYDMGHRERVTAAWRARTWLVGLKRADRVKLMNSSTDFWGFELDMNLTPYANQKISNTLGNLLGNADFVKKIVFTPKTRCLVFKDEQERPVAVLWACDPEVDEGKKRGSEILFADDPDVECFDLMEAPFAFQKAMELNGFPIFLRGKPGTLEAMLKALESAEISATDTPAAEASFAVVPPDKWNLTLKNGGKHPFSADIRINGSSRTAVIRPGRKESLSATLPAMLSPSALTFETMRADIFQKAPRQGRYTLSRELAAVLVKRAAITVDGDDSDWAQIPALPVTQRKLEKTGHPADLNFNATLKMAWDEKALYFLIDVKDAHHVLNPQTLPHYGWRNDSVQIFFDCFADGRDAVKRGMGLDDWEYGLYLDPETKKPYAYLHYAPDVQLTEGVHAARAETISDQVKFVCTPTPEGYRYEIAFLPRALLPFRLALGKQIGVSVLLNNQNDIGGAVPESRLCWGAKSDMPNGRPDLWPLVILTK